MGLCPDCADEGETVTYVGASKADIVNDVDPEGGEKKESDEGPETEVCDLCETEYVVDGDEG